MINGEVYNIDEVRAIQKFTHKRINKKEIYNLLNESQIDSICPLAYLGCNRAKERMQFNFICSNDYMRCMGESGEFH